MIEKISLRLFWTFAVLCAGTMLTGFWVYGEPTEFIGRLAVTFFILGFLSFLIWVPHITYRFYSAIEK